MNEGRIWAQGGFAELSQRFGVGATRVSTNKPQALAKKVKELEYVRSVDVDVRGLSIDLQPEMSQQLYEDILELAREAGAEILGIESGTASLEELFRLAVRKGEGDT